MAKTIVALLTLLLALVGPAAAQGSDPSTDPEQTGDGSDPNGGSPEPSSDQVRSCRVAVTHIGDPRITPDRWVIPDPDGCIRLMVERLVGSVTLAIKHLL